MSIQWNLELGINGQSTGQRYLLALGFISAPSDLTQHGDLYQEAGCTYSNEKREQYRNQPCKPFNPRPMMKRYTQPARNKPSSSFNSQTQPWMYGKLVVTSFREYNPLTVTETWPLVMWARPEERNNSTWARKMELSLCAEGIQLSFGCKLCPYVQTSTPGTEKG